MKGKIPRIVMVVVALVMAVSLVAAAVTVAPTTVSAATDRWSRQDLPTTNKYQMFPDSNIWDLTAADDGTLFALVEDTTGPVDIMGIAGPMTWDGLRWAIFPDYSDVALFKSTDGGYEWTLMWHMPRTEAGAPIAVVPQPGYDGTDADNQVIFIATGSRYQPALAANPPATAVAGGASQGNIYRSMGNGGSSFTRITPRCPAVTTLPVGGTITSIDVAENMGDGCCPGEYVVVVGVSSLNLGVGLGEGVYTWNKDGVSIWVDMQVSNDLPPSPFPGTLPAGNGMDVIQVMFSPDYTTDGQIVAVLNDIAGVVGSPVGIYVCFWDAIDGAWAGDPDSPTTSPPFGHAWNADYADAACMDVADDHTKTSATVFVGLDGCNLPPPVWPALWAANNDVWRVRGLTTVSGPSTATALGLYAVLQGVPGAPFPGGFISDITIKGALATGVAYVGCEFPARGVFCPGQAQVCSGENLTVWPTWSPAFKPPSGAWPVLLAEGDLIMAAGGGDGYTMSGVHAMKDIFIAKVYNGRGLLDDIAVSEDIPGYASPWGGTWCLVEAVYEEVSPEYAEDGIIYVATFSEWMRDYTFNTWNTDTVHHAGLSLWRWKPGGSWERILVDRLTLPLTMGIPPIVGYVQFAGKQMLTNVGTNMFVNDWTWVPRVSRDFSGDPYVFLLGGVGLTTSVMHVWAQEFLWYSLDKGDAFLYAQQMPIGTVKIFGANPWPGGTGLSETGWWVQDNNVIFLGDMNGFVYKTTDRGASWTEGAITALGLEVTSIETSPIYSETGESDKCLLVGTFNVGEGEYTPEQVIPGNSKQFPGTGKMEVWISQDGAIADLENVGAEINTDPGLGWGLPPLGGTVVNFDADWGVESSPTNRWVYAAASGWLDRWQLIGPGATELTRIDYSDISVCRTEVNLDEPSASTWEKMWDADDFNAEAMEPQPLPGMLPGADIYRWAAVTGLRIGHEGTIYAPFALWDMSYNIPGLLPTPNFPRLGRFTLGGVLRCLDGTQPTTEWNAVAGQDYGLGRWDGLWLARAVPGSNIIISLGWDWREWRFKLATYDDNLCQAGPDLILPDNGDTNVGEIVGEEVNVKLEWKDMSEVTSAAVTYQWQVDGDGGFTAPLLYDDMTTETFAELADLENGFEYFWRVRVIEPVYSPWSGPNSFTTTITVELGAPMLESPEAGAENVALAPMFEWSSVAWADDYHIEVATDSSFSSTVIDETLSAQAYQPASDLEENTTYYWRVKGSSATQDSDWSATGTFTTGPPPAEEGAGTPAWVWVVIVIGAILAIAVIVLIVRTRRPV